MFMVSLGTGGSIVPRDVGDCGLQAWSKAVQRNEEEFLQKALPERAYYRFQYPFENSTPEMDDIEETTILSLREAGDKLVENNDDSIRTLCQYLAPDSI